MRRRPWSLATSRPTRVHLSNPIPGLSAPWCGTPRNRDGRRPGGWVGDRYDMYVNLICRSPPAGWRIKRETLFCVGMTAFGFVDLTEALHLG
jgi:hypothetical protein